MHGGSTESGETAELTTAWRRSGILGAVRPGALAIGLLIAACGGGSPIIPTAPEPLAPWTVGGQVTVTLTGEGVGGVRLTSAQLEAWTDAEGRFAFQGEGIPGVRPVLAEHPGFVPRQTRMQGPLTAARTREDVAVDLIRDAAPFSLEFYRQLVRRGLEDPDALRPVQRWTTAPMWYLNTVTDDTGEAVPAVDLDQVEATLRASVPAWTGGAFAATVIERGTTPPTTQFGWVTVRFRREPDITQSEGRYCGRAQIAGNPGWIELILHPTTVSCCAGTDWMSTTVMAHEVGHALGFWHVAGVRADHLMTVEGLFCNQPRPLPSDVEQYHAQIAYSRQPGNTDPDNDPVFTILLQSGDPTPVVIACAG